MLGAVHGDVDCWGVEWILFLWWWDRMRCNMMGLMCSSRAVQCYIRMGVRWGSWGRWLRMGGNIVVVEFDLCVEDMVVMVWDGRVEILLCVRVGKGIYTWMRALCAWLIIDAGIVWVGDVLLILLWCDLMWIASLWLQICILMKGNSVVSRYDWYSCYSQGGRGDYYSQKNWTFVGGWCENEKLRR